MSEPIKLDATGTGGPYNLVVTTATGDAQFGEICRIRPDGSVKINWEAVDRAAALYRPDDFAEANKWRGMAYLLKAAREQRELPVEEKDLSWP